MNYSIASTMEFDIFLGIFQRNIPLLEKNALNKSDEVLRMKNEKDILFQVKRFKLKYLGHIMRNTGRYGLL